MAKKTQNNKSITRRPRHKDSNSQKIDRLCQKCGHQKNPKEYQIRFCDEEGEKEISLTFCAEHYAAFERHLKRLKLKTSDLLTEEQWTFLIIGFLSERNPILTACQKCGHEHSLGRHHPYPQRWFGHTIVLCDKCHVGIEREIQRQEQTEGKEQKELPKTDYAKLTMKFITECPPRQNNTSHPSETIISNELLGSQENFNMMSQTLVDTILELRGASMKMGRIAAYLKKMKRRKASWLQEESERAQKIIKRLEKLGDDFWEIEQLLKKSR